MENAKKEKVTSGEELNIDYTKDTKEDIFEPDTLNNNTPENGE